MSSRVETPRVFNPAVAGCELTVHALPDGQLIKALYCVVAEDQPLDDAQLVSVVLEGLPREQLPSLLVKVYQLPSELDVEDVGEEATAPGLGCCGAFINPRARPRNVVESVARLGREPAIFFLVGHGIYADVIRRLQTDREVVTLSLRWRLAPLDDLLAPGDLSRFVNLDLISRSYLALIRRRQPHGPYTLAGTSFGGLVALRVAQMLVAEGEHVDLVAMFDTYYPGAAGKLGLVGKLQGHIATIKRDGISHLLHKIRMRIAGWTRRPAWCDSGFSPGSLKWVIDRDLGARTFPADFRYDGSVLLFNPRVREPFAPKASGYGWELALDNLRVIKVAGRHHSLLREGADTIADAISARLRRPPASGTDSSEVLHSFLRATS